MSGVLKLFGYLSVVAGVVVAGILLLDPLVGMRPMNAGIGIAALAWFVGGLFWGALCITVASTHDQVAELKAELNQLQQRA